MTSTFKVCLRCAGKAVMMSLVVGTSVFSRIQLNCMQSKVPGASGLKQSMPRDRALIQAGKSVGPLSLGDSKARALELFPFKADVDQEWTDDCGTTFNWVQPTNKAGGVGDEGNMVMRFKNGNLFQIESATTRFHTREGITIYASPERVHHAYKHLRAYVLRSAPIRALGDRPLIYWMDKSSGIAFAFAFDADRGRRYLYEIIVFVPDTELCPEDQTTDSPNWQEIAPYSIEPPDTIT